MRWLRSSRIARVLLIAGAALLAVDLVLILVLHHGPKKAAPPAPTVTAPVTTAPATTTAPAPPATTTQPLPTPPPLVPMSWDAAGAIVWHAHDVDPTWLGQTLRADGFGWVAVVLGDDGTSTPTDPEWIFKFRQASGLPVGGWSSVGVDPAFDVANAVHQIRQENLAFYIADAEATYALTNGGGKDPARYARSQAFVSAFRAAEPSLPAALSSYCVANDLDLGAWSRGGFEFLPQAYVNDFGGRVTPAVCARSAAPYFSLSQVHPTVASYSGRLGRVSPARFSQLLADAGTTGFSIYPAEVAMTAQDWAAYGHGIRSLHIARVP
jgi:hypothetical protein